MSDSHDNEFDCVQSSRSIKDRLSAEIADLSPDELGNWLRSHRYTDARLKALAEKAAQPGVATDGPSACR